MRKYVIFIIGLSIWLTSCTKDIQPPSPDQSLNIVGTWKFRGSIEEAQTADSTYKSWGAAKIGYYPPYSLTFSDNGTGKSDTLTFTYKVEKNTIIIIAGNKTVSYIIKENIDKQIFLELNKDGVKEVSDISKNFTKLNLLATYTNLEQIKEETFPAGVYKICQVTTTDYPTPANGQISSNTSRIEYSYNEENKVIQTKEILAVNTENEGVLRTRKLHFVLSPYYQCIIDRFDTRGQQSYPSESYNVDNQLRISYSSTATLPGVKTPTYTTFSYNNSGSLEQKRIETYNFTGQVKIYTTEFYEYTAGGELTKVYLESQDNFGSQAKRLYQEISYTQYPVKEKVEYLYGTGKSASIPKHIKEIKTYAVDGTVLSVSKFEYEFDNLGRTTKKFSLDKDNNLIQLTEYNYNCN
jgi:hypothetical protein